VFAESKATLAESVAASVFLAVSPHEAKANVKAKPKKPNLNVVFHFIKIKYF
jgi:hypothetical protein